MREVGYRLLKRPSRHWLAWASGSIWILCAWGRAKRLVAATVCVLAVAVQSGIASIDSSTRNAGSGAENTGFVNGFANSQEEQIATADVIVCNEESRVVALKYDQKYDNAPRMIAKGFGRDGQQIQKIASENDVFSLDDNQLVTALYGLKAGDEIPESLYEKVAEILHVVYAERKRKAIERVADADVIVSDKQNLVVALKYNRESDLAPRVIAIGSGKDARRIQDIAKSSSVFNVENPALVNTLSKVELNEEIPEALYDDVAVVINLAYAENKNKLGRKAKKYAKNTRRASVRKVNGVRMPSQREYAKYIRNACNRYSVPEALAYAVISTESNFNPKAVSSVGAQGLMQLMPKTAAAMAVSDPFDPEQNITGGVRYIRELANIFNGDMVRIIAGYNAGPGAVRKYRGIPPYAETQDYVRKVVSRYYAYQEAGMEGEVD